MKNRVLIGEDCSIDVDKLVESRLLMQANSGGGKSYGLRKLLEQTHARVPHIVFDVEGEFHTLREKFDYVLAGQNGDCPADLKSASLLARRLMELGVSAIIDIYELGAQRARFVKLFLESLMLLPRNLWQPRLIVIDEADMFCPESRKSESTDAVIDLMTRGRKRGFCGVLATQRISKLHKDAAAECNNKLIGRSSLDIDMKRAASELGFTTREDMQGLRKLPAGTFYAFGPAISDVVREIKIGKVVTTHPKAGARMIAPTPPRANVKKVLAQLADLPHEAEEEAKTTAELKLKIRQLEGDARKAQAAQPKVAPAPVGRAPKTKIVEKPIVKDAQIKRLEKVANRTTALSEKLISALELLGTNTYVFKTQLLAAANGSKQPPPVLTTTVPLRVTNGVRPHVARSTPPPRIVASRPTPRPARDNDGKVLPKGEAAVLRAAIQFADGLYKRQLTVLTGYKRSTRDAYILRLRERGLIAEQGDRISVTAEGIAALPDAEPLPTGEALRDFWYGELPSGEKQILQILVDAYPDAVEKPHLDESTGFKRSTRDAYLLRLGAKELVVDVGRAEVKASDTLFEAA